MRKLLFLSLILLSFSVFAEDSTLKAIEDTSQVTFSKVYNDVKVGINAVASALKVGAEHVYEVLVKQQVVNAISELLLVIILFIVIIVGYRLTRVTYKAHLKEYEDRSGSKNADLGDTAKGPVTVILGIITGVCFIFALANLLVCYNSIVTGFVNPEYFALKEIMSWIK